MQKQHREELPPVFSSSQFTPAVAQALAKQPRRKPRVGPGYDAVEYRLNRYNGGARICSILHPRAYAELALCVQEHWGHIDYIVANPSSLIRPRQHKDGRLIIMDYERAFERTRRSLRSAFARRFVVKADISNFFPSLYSHALAWAAVGVDTAKKARSEKDRWFNRLDASFRSVSKDETHGVAIGPATSNIAAEIILARVDAVLRGCKFSFVRFVDDYTAHCKSEDEAQEFIRTLSDELATYRLALNIRKTEVGRLPTPLKPAWITELGLRLPRGGNILGHEATAYLDLALDLARETPDGSVLKYALRALIRQPLDPRAAIDVLRYAITVSFHHPILIPLLTEIIDIVGERRCPKYPRELRRLAIESARHRRSDGLAWALYCMNRFGVAPTEKVTEWVLDTEDCVALLVLFLSGKPAARHAVVAFAQSLDPADTYRLDRYWLLLYELFRLGRIRSPYADDRTFQTLKKHGVSFLAAEPVADSA
jgi:hypothetical protein